MDRTDQSLARLAAALGVTTEELREYIREQRSLKIAGKLKLDTRGRRIVKHGQEKWDGYKPIAYRSKPEQEKQRKAWRDQSERRRAKKVVSENSSLTPDAEPATLTGEILREGADNLSERGTADNTGKTDNGGRDCPADSV